MGKRRHALSDSQMAFTFEVPPAACEAGDLAGLSAMVAASVARMLREDKRDRAVIAKEVSGLLGEPVSVPMLNQYAAESRGDCNISVARWLALIAATRRHDVADAIATRAGMRVISGEEIVATELGHLQAEIDRMQRAMRDLRDRARPLPRAAGRARR